MLALLTVRCYPRNAWKSSRLGLRVEVLQRLDIGNLMVLTHGVEAGKRVPDAGCSVGLRHSRTEHGVRCAIRLRTGCHVISPGDVMLVQEVREVGPGIVRGRDGSAALFFLLLSAGLNQVGNA